MNCQSCGQPLKDTNRGTEKDGTPGNEYCNLCYEKGVFKQPNMTMSQMEEIYVEAMHKMHFPTFIGRFFAEQQLPKLKRWKTL